MPVGRAFCWISVFDIHGAAGLPCRLLRYRQLWHELDPALSPLPMSQLSPMREAALAVARCRRQDGWHFHESTGCFWLDFKTN